MTSELQRLESRALLAFVQVIEPHMGFSLDSSMGLYRGLYRGVV